MTITVLTVHVDSRADGSQDRPVWHMISQHFAENNPACACVQSSKSRKKNAFELAVVLWQPKAG